MDRCLSVGHARPAVVAAAGKALEESLPGLQRGHPPIDDVRGRALMLAIDGTGAECRRPAGPRHRERNSTDLRRAVPSGLL